MNIITSVFAAVSHRYEVITRRNAQQPEVVPSHQQPQVKVDIPVETLSRATLDKQSEGCLAINDD